MTSSKKPTQSLPTPERRHQFDSVDPYFENLESDQSKQSEEVAKKEEEDKVRFFL